MINGCIRGNLFPKLCDCLRKLIKDMDLDYIRDLTASYPPLTHNKVENKVKNKERIV